MLESTNVVLHDELLVLIVVNSFYVIQLIVFVVFTNYKFPGLCKKNDYICLIAWPIFLQMPDKDYSCHVNYDGVPPETKADSMLLSPKKTCLDEVGVEGECLTWT